MAAHGFVFSRSMTNDMHKYALNGRNATYPHMGQHIWHSGMMYINPRVASLPEHQHLFSGNGCYGGKDGNSDGGVPCKGEDALPAQYEPLLDCKPRKTKQEVLDCVKNPRAHRL